MCLTFLSVSFPFFAHPHMMLWYRKGNKMNGAPSTPTGSLTSLSKIGLGRKNSSVAYQLQQQQHQLYVKQKADQQRPGTSDSLESRSSRCSTGSMDDDWCVVTEASINKEIVLDMDDNEEVCFWWCMDEMCMARRRFVTVMARISLWLGLNFGVA